MNRVQSKRAAVCLVLAVLALVAPVNAATYGVRIQNFFFVPTNLMVHPGDTVVWTNRTLEAHDTSEGLAGTPDTQRLWKSALLNQNETFSFHFSNAGYYPYICKAHVVSGNPPQPQQTGSVSVIVGNFLPTVAITNLANGQSFFSPTNLTLGATNVDADGTVTNVSFFAGPNFLGSKAASPFTIVASNFFPGSYVLTARATDNQGGVGTSAPVNVTVRGRTNTISFQSFSFTPANLTVNVGDTIIFTNRGGTHTVTGTGTEPFCGAGSIPVSCAVVFPNVGSFGYRCNIHPGSMLGTITVAGPPSVSLTNPPNGSMFTAPASFTLGAAASKAGGSIVSVQFFHADVSLGTDTTSPYSADVSNLPAGDYTLTAKATDNSGLTAFAAPLTISVQPPPLQLVSPGVVGGMFQFDLTTVSGLTYVVQSSPALPASWTSLATNVAASNRLHFADPAPVSSNKFFRAFTAP